MDHVLSFFSHLILITAGLAVVLFWLIIFAVVAIEIWDLIFEGESTASDDDGPYDINERYYR